MAISTVVAVDPGPEVSGMVVLREGRIVKAEIVANGLLFNIMLLNAGGLPLMVLMEDVRPYGVRLRQELINTCKWIGQWQYRLEKAKIAYKLIPRSAVQIWVFRNLPDLVVPRIEKKIRRLDKRNKDGELCKPKFVYVDDGIVKAAMKQHWSIPAPKPGHSAMYGLKTHSWQALGVASCYLSSVPAGTPDLAGAATVSTEITSASSVTIASSRSSMMPAP